MADRFLSMFSGFGGADLGARMAGLVPVWGVDRDERVVGVARDNGLPFDCADVRDVDWQAVPDCDRAHASTECTRVSSANRNQGETEEDTTQADAVTAMLNAKRPARFTLENVPQYEGTESLRRIRHELNRLGYDHTSATLCAADYGTPQTRRRLILSASRVDRAALPTPTHAEDPKPADLFGFVAPKWNGWYASIADLLRGLPNCELAPWQRKRLPDEWWTMLVGQGGYDGRVATAERESPALTVTANHNQARMKAVLVSSHSAGGEGCPTRHGECPALAVDTKGGRVKAVLVDGQTGAGSSALALRDGGQPSRTVTTGGSGADVRALYVQGQNGSRSPFRDGHRPAATICAGDGHRIVDRALIASPRVRTVRLSPRCLARFQDFPDGYRLPDPVGLACLGIGNAFPPRFAAAVFNAA